MQSNIKIFDAKKFDEYVENVGGWGALIAKAKQKLEILNCDTLKSSLEHIDTYYSGDGSSSAAPKYNPFNGDDSALFWCVLGLDINQYMDYEYVDGRVALSVLAADGAIKLSCGKVIRYDNNFGLVHKENGEDALFTYNAPQNFAGQVIDWGRYERKK